MSLPSIILNSPENPHIESKNRTTATIWNFLINVTFINAFWKENKTIDTIISVNSSPNLELILHHYSYFKFSISCINLALVHINHIYFIICGTYNLTYNVDIYIYIYSLRISEKTIVLNMLNNNPDSSNCSCYCNQSKKQNVEPMPCLLLYCRCLCLSLQQTKNIYLVTWIFFFFDLFN